jgi:ABC-type microcin C transport system duplicated ATPase subunit YejF
MNARFHIATLAVAATAALGSQVAQAHILIGSDTSGATKSVSTKSVLAVMTAAGVRYHAAANYKNERTVGVVTTAPMAHVRPDDRGGPRL